MFVSLFILKAPTIKISQNVINNIFVHGVLLLFGLLKNSDLRRFNFIHFFVLYRNETDVACYKHKSFNICQQMLNVSVQGIITRH